MVDWVAMSKYASLVGTAMGIGLGITPIVPFYEIIRGKENVRIFPDCAKSRFIFDIPFIALLNLWRPCLLSPIIK